MPSFDIVSEVDLQEARNAVDNASREVESRFDFRGVEATFELNDANKTIKVLSESDFQVNQLLDILRAKLLKRGIEGTSLDVPEDIVHSGKTWFVEAKLKQGIESAVQKKIVKLIKDSKLKVQAQIQGEEIRVTGKSRDDLQSVMALVRGGDLGQPFQFKNFPRLRRRADSKKRGIPRFFYTPLMSCSISKRLVTLLSILIYTERSSGTTSA
ncbi:protein YajQ [Klebsiella aerogenes]|nr:protein YajQ [Klebsiella aerogenes]